MRQEIARGQEALDAVPLGPGVVDDQRCRRPVRVEAVAEPPEVGGIVFHMHAYGNEMLRDEIDDARIRVHLGIQPSATVSHRRGAEVEKDELAFRSRERGVEVTGPLNLIWHGRLPSCDPVLVAGGVPTLQNPGRRTLESSDPRARW